MRSLSFSTCCFRLRQLGRQSLPHSPPLASQAGTGCWPSLAWTKAQKFWLAVSPGSPLLSLFHVQPCPHMAPASASGLVAVFDYHRKKGYPDLYSLHSWCGILVFVLYFVQVSLTREGEGRVVGLRCVIEGPIFQGSCPEERELVSLVGCSFQRLNGYKLRIPEARVPQAPLSFPLTLCKR